MTSTLQPARPRDMLLSTGVRLRYAETGDPTGDPLILLHGYTDSAFSFSRLAPLLSDYRLIALDQRGHGESSRPDEGYAMADFAADVLALMDALGLPSASLVGHSMGTFVAVEAALAAPQRVERLALIDTAPAAAVPALLELETLVATLADPLPPEFVREFQASTAHTPLPGAFLDQVVAESLKVPARVWKAALGGILAADNRARLAHIQAPTLLLWGEHDEMFGWDVQQTLLAGLARATLVTYPDAGHAPHWECPAQVARDLAAFFQGGRS